MKTDTEILDWLEVNNTLHKQVIVLYVGDGYEVTIEYDGYVIYGPYFSENLRKAYLKAMKNG